MVKRIAFFCSLLALNVWAQKSDPVLMRVNGVDVPRSEFEYSYNKNRTEENTASSTSLEQYVDMFIDYKLKVQAALDARLDTVSSFKQEFLQVRDAQLTPYLVDEAYIDSVAQAVYAQNVQYIAGLDLIKPAHILLMVSQNATEAEKALIKQRADSVYSAIQSGASFEEMAQRFSDDHATARRGGQLPWMVPDAQLKEFSTAAYKLQKGEIGAPFEAPYGFQILKMTDRRTYGTFAEERAEILKILKQRGVEEQSAEAKLQKLITDGRGTRQEVLDSVLSAHLDNPELKYLVKEYHDGLLFYQIMKDKIWDPAKNDLKAQANYFAINKKKYRWSEPRFKGYVIHAHNKKQANAARKLLKANEQGDWKKVIKETFNKDSVTVVVSGPMLCKEGENVYVDQLVFKQNSTFKMPTKYAASTTYGKKLKQPKTYEDVKSEVETDLQVAREAEWLAVLRKKYPVTIYEDVLATVNKH